MNIYYRFYSEIIEIIFSDNIIITNKDIYNAYQLSNEKDFKENITQNILALNAYCAIIKVTGANYETYLNELYNDFCTEKNLIPKELKEKNISKISIILAFFNPNIFNRLTVTLHDYIGIFSNHVLINQYYKFISSNSFKEFNFFYFIKQNNKLYKSNFENVGLVDVNFNLNKYKLNNTYCLKKNHYIHVYEKKYIVHEATNYNINIWYLTIGDIEMLKRVVDLVEPNNPYSLVSVLNNYPNHIRIDSSSFEVVNNQNTRGDNIINYINNHSTSNGFFIYNQGNGKAMIFLKQGVYNAAIQNTENILNSDTDSQDVKRVMDLGSNIFN